MLLSYTRPGAPCYLTKFWDSCRHNSFTYAADGRCPERPASATTTHKSASSLLPHWLDGYSECNSCSSRVLLAHVESANCPVAYQGLKITTSLSSVSMIFSGGGAT
ncbi:hypothetical protein [Bathymodiolus platifrons methanotrophic gill symbiont]|uniref:hypothetical protein n=1 Tax=Bathymodiolus platifrons methanotrophic gill symbiont TaxID=113268 RepID=UPI001C8EBABB|nr:hypothetical protein [Bathymodiolus platifrons methanotrophic gill symbiont]